ncbi:MAG: hypothetical protein PHH77_07430 [Victivallaceae bacterium]|nr:hypothetical protein [Victivallaceae bacterium]
MAMADFEMDFGYKPQSDTEYRARIYGKNRLKRTIEMSMNDSELVLIILPLLLSEIILPAAQGSRKQ